MRKRLGFMRTPSDKPRRERGFSCDAKVCQIWEARICVIPVNHREEYGIGYNDGFVALVLELGFLT